MPTRIFFIHTVSGLHGMFNDLCAKHMTDFKTTHISDESLIQRALAAGGLTPVLYRRVCDHVAAAEEAGAEFIQLTCSSVSPCVDVARPMVGVPVLKIDEPVATQAVTQYARIGVIATACSTLTPSSDLVRQTAAAMGRTVEVTPVLCEGAYDAWFRGDTATHDRIVTEHLRDLMGRVDAVLLAQASMARLANAMSDAEKTVPILSSPEPAIEHLARLVRKKQAGE